MTGGRRWLGIGLIVVAAIVLIVWALLQTPTSGRRGGSGARTAATARPRATVKPTPDRLPPVRVEGTAISTVDPQGRQQWDIRAETVSVDGTAKTVTMTTVEGTFFEAGQPSVSFTAPHGTFFIASRNVTLGGGVHAQATSGRAFDADTVTWIPKAGQIEAKGNVVLRQEGMIVRADRLLTDTALQHTKLTGNIRVTVPE